MPLRLKNCTEKDRNDALGDVSFNRCFYYDASAEYAQVYVAFSMADFDFDSFAATIDNDRRRSLLKRIKSFFLPNTTQGHMFLTLTLIPGDGTAPRPIGEIPLASFSRTDKKGIVIRRNIQTRDGFYGPAILATAQTQVIATVRYTFTDDQSSRISKVLSDVSAYFSGLGLLRSKTLAGPKLEEAFAPIDKLIDTQFDVRAEGTNAIQLSVDPASTMAAYRHLTFNGVTDGGGHLYVGLAKLRSVLVNPPEDDGPLIYSSGGYGHDATDEILDRRIDGLTLRAHMRDAMGADFDKLNETQNVGIFLNGNNALGKAINAADLGLNANDKLALRWALLAGNPLLRRSDVRGAYLLANSEDALAALKLELPPVDVVLTDGQKALREATRRAADNAKTAMTAVNLAIQNGSDANNAAVLAGPGGAVATCPQRGAATTGATPQYCIEAAPGTYRYAGEAPTTDRRFSGYIAFDNGAKYTGSFILASMPVFQGHGRYSGGSLEPTLRDYSGEFANNFFSGFGIMRWKDGREFHGQFANDVPNGYGILYDADGTAYYTQYVAGDPTGEVLRKRPSSPKFDAGRWCPLGGQSVFCGDE